AVLPMHLVPASQAQAGQHTYNEVLPLMLARYCGPGLLGLGITALVAGFMAGMAGDRDAPFLGWVSPLLYPLFPPHGPLMSLRFHGPLVHHDWPIREHRDGISRDEFRQHHGLRAGAVWLLHRAAVWHRSPGHAVETREPRGRLFGPAGRCALFRCNVHAHEA